MKKMKSVARRMTLIALGYVMQFIIMAAIAIIGLTQIVGHIPRTWKGILGTVLFIYSVLVHHVSTGYFISLYKGYSTHMFLISMGIILYLVFTSRSVKDMMRKPDVELR